MDSTVVIEPAYNALSDVRALFEAYTAMLVTHDPAFQIYLDIQHYADELRAPAAKYAPPDGRLYLARVDGRAAGCIALRRLDGERCEMKRLYVQPQYRGRGLARQLIRRITEDARQDMEKFLQSKVFLTTYVKVKEDWRDRPNLMKEFGYEKPQTP